MSKLDEMIDDYDEKLFSEQEIICWLNSLKPSLRTYALCELNNIKKRGYDTHKAACKLKLLYDARQPTLWQKFCSITLGWQVGGFLNRH